MYNTENKKLSFDDVAKKIGKTVFELKEDYDLTLNIQQGKNFYDTFDLGYWLGILENRYKFEIGIYNKLLASERYENSFYSQEISLLNHYMSQSIPQIDPVSLKYNDLRSRLDSHLNNILEYILIRSGSDGIKWFIEQLGEKGKEYFSHLMSSGN